MKLPPNYKHVIDELGDLDRRLEPYEKLKKRRDELREEVRKWATQMKAEASKTLDGNRYAVNIGQKRMETVIVSMAAVVKRVGLRAFLSICSVTLKALRQKLSPEELNKLTVTERTGHREITTMPRLAAAEKKAA